MMSSEDSQISQRGVMKGKMMMHEEWSIVIVIKKTRQIPFTKKSD